MKSVCFSIPIRISSLANDSRHWTKKWKERKNKIMGLKYYLSGAGEFSLPVRVILERVSPRMLDEHDNLRSALKPFVDTIASHLRPGLAPGRADDSQEIEWVYVQKKGGVRENFLNVVIEEKKPNIT